MTVIASAPRSSSPCSWWPCGSVILSGVQVTAFPFPVLNLAVTVVWLLGDHQRDQPSGQHGRAVGGDRSDCSRCTSALCVPSAANILSAHFPSPWLRRALASLSTTGIPRPSSWGTPARLFLGFMLASLGIKLRFPANVSFVTWMIPPLVLGVPILDTTLVVISRLRRGLNPLTTPGTDHSSHRLTYAGLTRREAVLVLYVASFVLGLLADLCHPGHGRRGLSCGRSGVDMRRDRAVAIRTSPLLAPQRLTAPAPLP